MHRHRRAKIVATVGPASSSPEMLRALVRAGVDTVRLNFSHGTHDDHASVHAAIRALEQEVRRPIGILLDLQGPKIRVGILRGGRMTVEPGEMIGFVLSGSDGDRSAIPLPHPQIFAAVAPGHDLLIDDGRVRVRVTGLGQDFIEAKVIVGGVISNHKGVNLPGTVLDLSPLTTRDRADLEFGLRLGVDWVALSFVQKPSDVTARMELAPPISPRTKPTMAPDPTASISWIMNHPSARVGGGQPLFALEHRVPVNRGQNLLLQPPGSSGRLLAVQDERREAR